MTFRRAGSALAVAVLLVSSGLGSVAHAATVGCGDVITRSTTLDADIGPCPGDGLLIDADNITLDLGGHTVLGAPSSSIGILVTARSGVRIANGTVTGFQTGVNKRLGQDNTIERLLVRDNRCSGIVLSPGFRTVVRGSAITGNGCAGLTLAGESSATVEANSIAGNLGPGVAFFRGSINFQTTRNIVRGNAITNNGSDGVQVNPFASFNSIISNHIASNGRHGVYINVFSGDLCCTLVQGNTVSGNAGNGVLIEANRPISVSAQLLNQVLSNTASGNGVFDLADLNIDCDENTWAGNRFGTRNQPCIH